MDVIAIDSLTIVGFSAAGIWFAMVFGTLVYFGWKGSFSGGRRRGE